MSKRRRIDPSSISLQQDDAPVPLLPAELIRAIFEKLQEFSDLIRCSAVCRAWRRVAHSSAHERTVILRGNAKTSAQRARAANRSRKANTYKARPKRNFLPKNLPQFWLSACGGLILDHFSADQLPLLFDALLALRSGRPARTLALTLRASRSRVLTLPARVAAWLRALHFVDSNVLAEVRVTASAPDSDSDPDSGAGADAPFPHLETLDLDYSFADPEAAPRLAALISQAPHLRALRSRASISTELLSTLPHTVEELCVGYVDREVLKLDLPRLKVLRLTTSFNRACIEWGATPPPLETLTCGVSSIKRLAPVAPGLRALHLRWLNNDDDESDVVFPRLERFTFEKYNAPRALGSILQRMPALQSLSLNIGLSESLPLAIPAPVRSAVLAPSVRVTSAPGVETLRLAGCPEMFEADARPGETTEEAFARCLPCLRCVLGPDGAPLDSGPLAALCRSRQRCES